MLPSALPVALGATLLFAVAETVPTLNVEPGCRAAAKMGDSQTTGMAANTGQHPPTGTMNQKTGDVAASSQDTQRQMQGEPTAAQQAEGAKAGSKTAHKDC